MIKKKEVNGYIVLHKVEEKSLYVDILMKSKKNAEAFITFVEIYKKRKVRLSS